VTRFDLKGGCSGCSREISALRLLALAKRRRSGRKPSHPKRAGFCGPFEAQEITLAMALPKLSAKRVRGGMWATKTACVRFATPLS
jgi:hypothetical protein